MRTVVWVVAAWCAASGPASACGMGYVGEVPMSLQDGDMVVPIEVNGVSKPMHIAFDGANAVDAATAREFRLEAVVQTGTNLGTQSGVLQDGTEAEFKEMKARTARISGVQIPDLYFDVDLNKGKSTNPVAGGSMFGPFDLDFDVKGGRLILYFTPEGCTGAVTMSGDLFAAPIQHLTEQIQFTGRVNDADVRMQLSGSGESRMTRSLARRLNLTPSTKDGHDLVTATLDIAGVGLRNHHFVLINDLGTRWRPDVVVGSSLFTHTHVWVSHSMRKLILQVPAQPSPPAPK